MCRFPRVLLKYGIPHAVSSSLGKNSIQKHQENGLGTHQQTFNADDVDVDMDGDSYWPQSHHKLASENSQPLTANSASSNARQAFATHQLPLRAHGDSSVENGDDDDLESKDAAIPNVQFPSNGDLIQVFPRSYSGVFNLDGWEPEGMCFIR